MTIQTRTIQLHKEILVDYSVEPETGMEAMNFRFSANAPNNKTGAAFEIKLEDGSVKRLAACFEE